MQLASWAATVTSETEPERSGNIQAKRGITSGVSEEKRLHRRGLLGRGMELDGKVKKEKKRPMVSRCNSLSPPL